jgi:hypothetical protein
MIKFLLLVPEQENQVLMALKITYLKPAAFFLG